ncbi:transposase [Streptomyces sp. NPDC006290]|uniref:transposase n=1 Tax=Streptomyces sp. NPDC006290 TaxID=3156745 RepID=UPI0033A15500
MAALVTGVLSGNGPRTVTGMWQTAGLAGKAHWSRAHRFFSRAVWDLDQVGLALARAVVARFVPRGAAVTLAVDEKLVRHPESGDRDDHVGNPRGRPGRRFPLRRGRVQPQPAPSAPRLRVRHPARNEILAQAEPRPGSVNTRCPVRGGELHIPERRKQGQCEQEVDPDT